MRRKRSDRFDKDACARLRHFRLGVLVDVYDEQVKLNFYISPHPYLLAEPYTRSHGCEIRVDFVASKLMRDYSTGNEKKNTCIIRVLVFNNNYSSVDI